MNGEVALVSGERLLWTGRPSRWRGFLRPGDMFLFASAFAAVLFVAVVIATASSGPAQPEPSAPAFVYFLPVVFLALISLGSRLVSARREMGGASYALTDRRIVIRGPAREVELGLADLRSLQLERSWLSGATILLNTRQVSDRSRFVDGRSPMPALRGLREAERVYRLIREARPTVSPR